MLKKYQKEFDYSYALGVFPTMELLLNKPEVVETVYISSKGEKNEGIQKAIAFCKEHNITIEVNDKQIDKLATKDNVYCIGVFKKYHNEIDANVNHVVLHHPSDMGNMGTIIRTMLGFGYSNLVIIAPGVDVFDPKVVRASMGAIFSINIKYFNSFEEYYQNYKDRSIFCLMLQASIPIQAVSNKTCVHTLIFGNESSGLPNEFSNYGQAIIIPHLNTIDSLNLSMALGITLFEFSREIMKGR